MKSWLLLLLISISTSVLKAQVSPQQIIDFNEERELKNKKGMMILGSWALVNIGLSATKLKSIDPKTRSYHQMNLAWNSVNLGIAIYGFYQASTANYGLNLMESLEAQERIQQILLINAGLDLLYIGSGFALNHWGNKGEKALRNQGFGQAIAVNGAFLLAFDLLFYWMHRQDQLEFLKAIPADLRVSAQSLSLHLSF
ncbi:DUF6992 family protein [Croceimicrobium hydrocarbonivorans]|uniref:Uncharacterized protein n=1 Tax=Croceimicrobium hydrocarbonivorans TaxID=2761580 RepID=A0A7H0VBE4_9FLAO|nr:hypothetical protein [Croceimicrobium hydrocarbonivorans]QNR23042.1 hypothetical protein H4K34_11705 [Croceimicrobium hydrocarbonivorans]